MFAEAVGGRATASACTGGVRVGSEGERDASPTASWTGRSDRLAGGCCGGAGVGELVALAAERGIELLVASSGFSKAGAAT